MKVLVIGGGGREHALCWKLAQSKRFSEVFASPGNPGISRVAACLPAQSNSPDAYVLVAKHAGAGLTVVGPEAPLAAGIVDAFRSAGLHIIGPTARAAQLEASKVFAKSFMLRAGIPTARSITASDTGEATGAVRAFSFPVVLKADGLAAGKGVIIVHNAEEAHQALAMLPPGRIVVEEFLEGEEASYIVLAEGERFQTLAATQDHKAVRDGDQGPNTGGMGAYCDGRILTSGEEEEIVARVIRPALALMVADGVPYTGFLYAGIMMTSAGPKVLEFNARLGDPETQALMHRMDNDLGDVLLGGAPFEWKSDPSVCVVMAAAGYPAQVRTGDPIRGAEDCGGVVFHAGTRLGARGLETAGGRVLGVTAGGKTLAGAIEAAYRAVDKIHFEGMHFRRDIGRKGLKRW